MATYTERHITSPSFVVDSSRFRQPRFVHDAPLISNLPSISRHGDGWIREGHNSKEMEPRQ
uniref:Uncharacterized protein n=1 Tax=Aegilops tauschii subsp. strangulata TaxID=200361 RepID=A0A453CZ81_AEGTS